LLTTKVFNRLASACASGRYRVFGLQGGTSSSKTYSTLQLLAAMAERDTRPTLTSIVSETIPHLKRGVIRDFFKIIDSTEKDYAYNISNMVYTFPNGSQIEFFSADDPAKLRGARRDRLYMNECNNIDYFAYSQLEPRTKQKVFLDWNPESRFWFHDKVQDTDGVWFDISTYHDNEFLDQSIKDSIEARRLTDPEWFRVYGEGLIGQYEGLVFRNLHKSDLSEVYPTIDRIYHGIDFGFFPDPAVYVMVGIHNDKLYIFKEIVANDLDNQQLAELVKPWAGQNVVYCDSAEPKSIQELKKHGVNARSCGGKERQYSINWIRNKEIHIHTECPQAWREFERFSRKKDRNGEVLPIFADDMEDHVIDAVRYALTLPIFNRGVSQGLQIGGI